jgi:hypothetical protein
MRARAFLPAAFFLAAAAGASVPPGMPSSQSRPADLAAVLERCAGYCDRLSGAILDFVCTEEVDENIASLGMMRPSVRGGSSGAVFFTRPVVSVEKRTRSRYQYDYQLVRTRSGEITETRVLLGENGHRVHEVDAPLKTKVFHYKYVVMGPVGLLGRAQQRGFDYSVVKETTFNHEPVFIIQAVPRPGSEGEVLYGKAWVRRSDAEILKIEWEPESMGNYEGIEEMAREMDMKPRLAFSSEYLFEKNGIRFASRLSVEEAYLTDKGKAFVRSKTEVAYKDFKFFSVEYDVRD